MNDSQEILKLYLSVLNRDVDRHNLSAEDIRVGIQNMKEMYMPRRDSLISTTAYVVDYDDVAHRCAYLHKYAPLHTAMVSDMLSRSLIFYQNFYSVLFVNSNFKLCSLGAGPGTDVIGVMHAMHSKIGCASMSATLVDCKAHWKNTFSSLVDELRYGEYGSFGYNFAPKYLDWKYLGSNLLCKMNGEVNQALGSANLVTMVKFLSAAACVDTEAMIRKIFNVMKPGAMVLYIDNAAGGFHRLVTKAAKEFHFVSIFGPLQHEQYINETFNVKLFGYFSCYQTKVTVHLLQKDNRVKADASLITSSNIPGDQRVILKSNEYGVLSHQMNTGYTTLPKFKPPTSHATDVNAIKSIPANPGPSKYCLTITEPTSKIPDQKTIAAKSLVTNKSQAITTQKNFGREKLETCNTPRKFSDSATALTLSRQSKTTENKVDTLVAANKFSGTAPQKHNMFVRCTKASFANNYTKVRKVDQTYRETDPLTKINSSPGVLAENPSTHVPDYGSSWNATETIRRGTSARNSSTLPPVSSQRTGVPRASLQDRLEENCCCCLIS